MPFDFSSVTELPSGLASQEQLTRLHHRYRSAAQYCEGKDVLEVGCGAGLGLGYLSKRARLVIGGDYTETNLCNARRNYKDRAKLVRLDAHHLPFKDKSFDVILLLEAIYYLNNSERFFEESRRVLRNSGILLICTVNKDWPDFNPSPFSVKYYSAPQLAATLREMNFDVELFGAFPDDKNSVRAEVISIIKRLAVTLHLMPRTMKHKELLKRIFFGKLSPIPAEVDDRTMEYIPPVPIPPESPDLNHKVLYALGRTR
jgi:ubiquinone/menaquinone biosynthesis C-methylase UbiE